MPKERVSLAIVLLLLCAALLGGCAKDTFAQTSPQLQQIQENLAATQEISDQLVEICNWQIDQAKAYWEEYDQARAAGESLEDSGDNYDEVKGKYDELLAQMDALQKIEDAYAPLTPAGEQALDDTSKVYESYLADIRTSAEDIKNVFAYYFAMRDALKPFEEFEFAQNETGLTDYALMAGQLSGVIMQTQKALKAVDCPAYMQSSHKVLSDRIDEMQQFSQDFSIAVQLSDPLRLASSVYRAERIDTLIDQCSRKLDDDFSLQFAQAVKRLNGPVASMRSELDANIDILSKAMA